MTAVTTEKKGKDVFRSGGKLENLYGDTLTSNSVRVPGAIFSFSFPCEIPFYYFRIYLSDRTTGQRRPHAPPCIRDKSNQCSCAPTMVTLLLKCKCRTVGHGIPPSRRVCKYIIYRVYQINFENYLKPRAAENMDPKGGEFTFTSPQPFLN